VTTVIIRSVQFNAAGLFAVALVLVLAAWSFPNRRRVGACIPQLCRSDGIRTISNAAVPKSLILSA
jgi:hypothetical protein